MEVCQNKTMVYYSCPRCGEIIGVNDYLLDKLYGKQLDLFDDTK